MGLKLGCDNRTSADEDQIDDVTFGDTFDTNKIKRRSDHEDRNKKENSEKNAYEVDVVKRATRGIHCKKHNKTVKSMNILGLS